MEFLTEVCYSTGKGENVSKMPVKNKVKIDTVLKNFWRDNHRFADLFNAVFFKGTEVLKAADFSEADTDVSSMMKFNGHAETVQKVWDVVKKTAYGIDFVILGLENQEKIHYAMPLRHMIGDAFLYLKEYDEIAAKNRKEKTFTSSEEFLSNFKKTDRLHPVVSLCVYYGEKEWDGPHTLKDMLEVPGELQVLVSDYKMNLLEVRKSGSFQFNNSDVAAVFDISRFIYERDYEKINRIYKERTIPTELGVVIGAITKSQKLIDEALKSEEKGGQLYMCSALEELENRGVEKGLEKGVAATVRTCKRFHIDKKITIEVIAKEFSVSEEKAVAYVKKYW